MITELCVGETLAIDTTDAVRIRVVEASGGVVLLAIDAPDECRVQVEEPDGREWSGIQAGHTGTGRTRLGTLPRPEPGRN